jgi:hypothetical protein
MSTEYFGWISKEYFGCMSTEYLGWISTEYFRWMSTECLGWISTEYLVLECISVVMVGLAKDGLANGAGLDNLKGINEQLKDRQSIIRRELEKNKNNKRIKRYVIF